MDEKTKERFRGKFYILAILLNLIILLAAVAVIGFFLGPKPYNIAIAGVLLILVVVLSLYFARRYRATKEWLHEQD
jgi:membrane protein YdbS with pleckstrin-like domain